MPTKGCRPTDPPTDCIPRLGQVRKAAKKIQQTRAGKKPVKYRKLLFKFTATTTGSDNRESIRK